VLVAGAGPAGAAVALCLARLGHSVCVVGVPRPFDACEGISRRVVDGLRQAGFRQALEQVSPPVMREVEWNGERRAQNAESLLWRPGFDAALTLDLQQAGVRVMPARIAAVQHDDHAPGLRLADGAQLRARVVVEARGRAAPQGRGVGLRGPATLAVLTRARGPAGPAGSAVFACADGWVWLARLATGQRYLQLCVAADTPGLPKRAGLAAWTRERIAALPQAQAWLHGCVPEGPPTARASTASLHARPWDRGVLRVGDAAMAVDPLSGNGIFQSLSSATTAPAVINTLLRSPQYAALALDFHAARLRETFLRFARIGRDFHAVETRWAIEAFWRERSAWPDAVAAHAPLARIDGPALRAVIEGGLIREREVLITSEQPLGVWRVEGVEIAPLLRDLPAAPAARAAALQLRIATAAPEPAQQQQLRAWLRRHDALPGGA
jgi:flavin-dependent dehydrogenase